MDDQVLALSDSIIKFRQKWVKTHLVEIKKNNLEIGLFRLIVVETGNL